jgi:hypothetical protein
LKNKFARASRLPKAAQKQLAEQMLEDIEGEMRWDQTLSESQPLLERMTAKARAAKQQRKTVRKGVDKL